MQTYGYCASVHWHPNDAHTTNLADGCRSYFDINRETDAVADRMGTQAFQLGSGVLTVVRQGFVAGYASASL